jgi:YfiH family protein
VLRSPLLERARVPHAFATRQGGVSTGHFSSLNFGNPGELTHDPRDPTPNIRENYRRLLEAAGCAGRALAEVHQVHGPAVLELTPETPCPAAPQKPDTKADAIVTNDPERTLAIRIADCAPVLIASADGRIVAAVHAGWRGVITGVVAAAIASMRRLGGAPALAAIGPCIGPAAFEVGPEVAAEFQRVFPSLPEPLVTPGRADRSHVNLAAAIRIQLLAGGIHEIDVCGRCTASEPDWFFSHRRDGLASGRMAAVIAPVSPRV